MPETCTAIIDRLIAKRKEKGLTQRDLAEATGLSQPMIARFERKTNAPQLDTLLKVADALDCTLAIIE